MRTKEKNDIALAVLSWTELDVDSMDKGINPGTGLNTFLLRIEPDVDEGPALAIFFPFWRELDVDSMDRRINPGTGLNTFLFWIVPNVDVSALLVIFFWRELDVDKRINHGTVLD